MKINMALNYGHSRTITVMTPASAGRAIFATLDVGLQGQYGDPPHHAKTYVPIGVVSPNSVIQYLAHSFRGKLAVNDDVIVYYLSTLDRTSGAITNHKALEYTPKSRFCNGTVCQYEIMSYVRIGDVIPESYLESASVFYFTVGKKTGGADPADTGSNLLTWVILSPLEITI